MRPPICAICDEDFREVPEKGDGIYFTLSETDKLYNEKLKQSDMVGHPAGFEWFCNKHLKIALHYQYLTLAEALVKINNEIT